MNLAIELANLGKGHVNPNPLVGAVIVKNKNIIGQGYHEKYGDNHGEINAFNSATESVVNSDLYVTLEPCSHYGKTPPCVDRIIKEQVARVFIGSLDPNPLVAGRGVSKLKNAGIEVVVGVLEEQCKNINEVFFKYIETKKPFVLMKWAMSLDGKIASKTGESKWITGEIARNNVHKLRNEFSGIMVGVNTIIKDNPRLDCRIENGRNPIRIIVDSKLRIPIDSKVLNHGDFKTIIATTKLCDNKKLKTLEDLGAKVIIVTEKNHRVDLNKLMKILGDMNIDSILLEGGGVLNFSALESNIVDKIQVYIAPKIIGGKDSKTPVEGNGIEFLKDAYSIGEWSTNMIGNDLFIEGYLNNKCEAK